MGPRHRLQHLLRPYKAAFASRFLLMLQYRTAAYAGFATQCWWGAIKTMVLAAFYGSASASAGAPISLEHAITYTWVAQDRLGHDQRKAQPRVQHQGLAADGTGNSQRLRHAAKGPSPERVQQRLPRRKKPLQHAGQRPGQGDMPLGESIAQAHGSRAERAGFAGDDQPRFTHASKSSCRILDSAPGSPWSSP